MRKVLLLAIIAVILIPLCLQAEEYATDTLSGRVTSNSWLIFEVPLKIQFLEEGNRVVAGIRMFKKPKEPVYYSAAWYSYLSKYFRGDLSYDYHLMYTGAEAGVSSDFGQKMYADLHCFAGVGILNRAEKPGFTYAPATTDFTHYFFVLEPNIDFVIKLTGVIYVTVGANYFAIFGDHDWELKTEEFRGFGMNLALKILM